VLHAKSPSPRRVIGYRGEKAMQSTSGREESWSHNQCASLSKGCSVAARWGIERNPKRSFDHQRLWLFPHRSPL